MDRASGHLCANESDFPANALESHEDGDTLLTVSQKIAGRVHAFLDSEASSPLLQAVQEQTRVALGVIGAALDGYSLAQLTLAYNGGKDCLVLLMLVLTCLSTYTQGPLPRRLPSIYIVTPHPFPEVTSFVERTAFSYQLELARYAMPLKEAFAIHLQQHTELKAVLVGTRRTDPHGAVLTHFDETDRGWPSFIRVHPVIDWHYREVWAFLRYFDIPYCELYDRGYTSLGGMRDTRPNPALKEENVGNGKEDQTFRPAYELADDKEERLGRDW